MNRRNFLTGLVLCGGALLLGRAAGAEDFITGNVIKKKKEKFPFELSDEEWRARLTPEQYEVMREEGTERTCSSPLHKEKRAGTYHCAGCGAPLFLSHHKFISKSGWPSFYQPVSKDAIGSSTDFSLVLPRTEIHCATCGSHLGHVFDDGPPPTGRRYCINGLSLIFVPD
ncbi:MAG: peptide-methionine (R)-S-oxide reductase MsrB [Rhodospirillales bacterium]|nr:peptide-methionine (R)-S-oxide reductase MsrB [Alphaproteobacteria bacterium]USO03726.1 MAG: peptide-methionine (R)-S-oxide reductase MsrB [Rhodospirillales bacterium]